MPTHCARPNHDSRRRESRRIRSFQACKKARKVPRSNFIGDIFHREKSKFEISVQTVDRDQIADRRGDSCTMQFFSRKTKDRFGRIFTLAGISASSVCFAFRDAARGVGRGRGLAFSGIERYYVDSRSTPRRVHRARIPRRARDVRAPVRAGVRESARAMDAEAQAPEATPLLLSLIHI